MSLPVLSFLSEGGSDDLSNLITLRKEFHAMQHPHTQERS